MKKYISLFLLLLCISCNNKNKNTHFNPEIDFNDSLQTKNRLKNIKIIILLDMILLSQIMIM